MSDKAEFKEILGDGIIPGAYEPTRFSNPFLNDYAAKLLEVHETPKDIIDDMCGEPIFWLNSEELKFKKAEPVVSRRIYSIGDEVK